MFGGMRNGFKRVDHSHWEISDVILMTKFSFYFLSDIHRFLVGWWEGKCRNMWVVGSCWGWLYDYEQLVTEKCLLSSYKKRKIQLISLFWSQPLIVQHNCINICITLDEMMALECNFLSTFWHLLDFIFFKPNFPPSYHIVCSWIHFPLIVYTPAYYTSFPFQFRLLPWSENQWVWVLCSAPDADVL